MRDLLRFDRQIGGRRTLRLIPRTWMIWRRTLPFVRGVRWTEASRIRFTARLRQWLTSLHFLSINHESPNLVLHRMAAPRRGSTIRESRRGHHADRSTNSHVTAMSFTTDDKIQQIAEAYALDACDFLRDHFRITLDWSDASIQYIESVLDTFHRE